MRLRVYRQLGTGFLERVYHRALHTELTSSGIQVRSDVAIPVSYKDILVGNFFADLVVDERIVIEIKAQPRLMRPHEAQILNHLRASKLPIGLLVNFTHPRATIRRFLY